MLPITSTTAHKILEKNVFTFKKALGLIIVYCMEAEFQCDVNTYIF